MDDLLREIRATLSLQQELTGSWMPLESCPEDIQDSETSPPGTADSTPATREQTRSSETEPNHSHPTDAPSSMSSTLNMFDEGSGEPTEPPRTPYDRIEQLIAADSEIREFSELSELERYVAERVLVPIDENRQNPVFGVGPDDADLLLIGEAPGRDEDRQGEPFVGRAGQLLNKILNAIDFEREEVYIANILKSRPPRNRNPKPEEVEAHLPLLYKQIALLKPRVILALGKVAGNTLLDRSSSLKNLRGEFHDFYGIPLMVTYHPAALLRNPQWKRATWNDVKLLRKRYDELTASA